MRDQKRKQRDTRNSEQNPCAAARGRLTIRGTLAIGRLVRGEGRGECGCRTASDQRKCIANSPYCGYSEPMPSPILDRIPTWSVDVDEDIFAEPTTTEPTDDSDAR